MRIRHIATAILLTAAAAAVPLRPGSTQVIQQCYHRVIIDPADACTTCSNTCLGAGYKCCIIISN